MRDMVGKIVMDNDYSKVCVKMPASQAKLFIKNTVKIFPWSSLFKISIQYFEISDWWRRTGEIVQRVSVYNIVTSKLENFGRGPRMFLPTNLGNLHGEN